MAAPIPNSISVDVSQVDPGDTVTLTVNASDPDSQVLVGEARVQSTGESRQVSITVADPVEFSLDPATAGPDDVLVTVTDGSGSLVPLTPAATPGVYTFVAPGN